MRILQSTTFQSGPTMWPGLTDRLVGIEEAKDYALAAALGESGSDAEAAEKLAAVAAEWVRRYPDRPVGYKRWAQRAHDRAHAIVKGKP